MLGIRRFHSWGWLILAGFMAIECHAIDTVHRRSTDRPVGGTIAEVTRTEVTVNVPPNRMESVPANDIRVIEWENEPAVLKRARSEENGGQYAAALNSYREALNATSNNNVRSDIQFYLARTTARIALADPSQLDDAQTLLQEFVNQQRSHYRFFDAQLWLGDVALAAEQISTAESAFNSLANSPWPDYQMAGKIGLARAMLSRGDLDGARQGFDEVVNTPATDEASRTRRLEAMLGQARVHRLQQNYETAITQLTRVIQETPASATNLLAEAYVLKGSCLEAMGADPKQAIMAYLPVDVISALARESEFHAEALYHLTLLWRAVGDTRRSEESSLRLQTLYPESEWTTRLTGG